MGTCVKQRKTNTHRQVRNILTEKPTILCDLVFCCFVLIEISPSPSASHMKTHLSSISVIFLLICRQKLGEAEVGDLDVVRTLQKDVPCSQVAMHQVTLLQVVHPLHTNVMYAHKFSV